MRLRSVALVVAVIVVLLGTTLDTFAIDPALDARNYPGPSWSPYLVGAGIGILSWLTFYFSDKSIGASSFYATVAGFIGKAIAPRHTESLEYFKTNRPKLNWESLPQSGALSLPRLRAAASSTSGCQQCGLPDLGTACCCGRRSLLGVVY
jgi:hypothetical protein